MMATTTNGKIPASPEIVHKSEAASIIAVREASNLYAVDAAAHRMQGSVLRREGVYSSRMRPGVASCSTVIAMLVRQAREQQKVRRKLQIVGLPNSSARTVYDDESNARSSSERSKKATRLLGMDSDSREIIDED